MIYINIIILFFFKRLKYNDKTLISISFYFLSLFIYYIISNILLFINYKYVKKSFIEELRKLLNNMIN